MQYDIICSTEQQIVFNIVSNEYRCYLPIDSYLCKVTTSKIRVIKLFGIRLVLDIFKATAIYTVYYLIIPMRFKNIKR